MIPQRTIQEAVERLRKAANPVRIILFGSYALSDIKETSDLDFLVVKEDGLLSKEEKGLAHIYKLKSENSVVEHMKKAYGIAFVLSSKPKEKFLKIDPNIISLALFGSFAEGSFDEKSVVFRQTYYKKQLTATNSKRTLDNMSSSKFV